MSCWISKTHCVYVQCVSSVSFHLCSKVFPVGPPCTIICQGQLFFLLQWQFVLFKNGGAHTQHLSLSLSLLSPYFPVITFSHIQTGNQIHFQSVYHEKLKAVWKILICVQHFLKAYTDRVVQLEILSGFKIGFAAKIKSASLKKEVCLKHSHLKSQAVQLGWACEVASQRQSCLEFSETAQLSQVAMRFLSADFTLSFLYESG